jgi:hypothetical protein
MANCLADFQINQIVFIIKRKVRTARFVVDMFFHKDSEKKEK